MQKGKITKGLDQATINAELKSFLKDQFDLAIDNAANNYFSGSPFEGNEDVEVMLIAKEAFIELLKDKMADLREDIRVMEEEINNNKNLITQKTEALKKLES